MHMKLGTKVTGMMVLLFIISVCVTILVGLAFQDRIFMQGLSAQLSQQVVLQESAVKHIMISGNSGHLLSYVKELNESGIECFIFDGNGKALKGQDAFKGIQTVDMTQVYKVLGSGEILENKERGSRVERMVPFLNEKRCQICHGVEKLVNGVMVTRVKEKGFAEAMFYVKKIVWISSTLWVAAISLSVWFWIREQVIRPILAVSRGMREIAFGAAGLVKRIRKQSDDEIGELTDRFNDVLDQVHGMIGDMGNAASEIAAAAQDLSVTSEHITKGMEKQSRKAEEVAKAVDEMAATVIVVAKNSNSAAEAAEESSIVAKKGKTITDNNMSSMARISEIMKKASASARVLSTRTQEVGEITKVIDDIADKTKLLALNAAIEAARAGVHGRGFAVVADEIRKLSEKTSKATQEISEMIRIIQTDAGEAVVSMMEGFDQVENGNTRTQEAGSALLEIVGKATNVQEKIRHTAAAMEEASLAVDDISQSMTEISFETKEASRGSLESIKASRQLTKLAESLKRKIRAFRI